MEGMLAIWFRLYDCIDMKNVTLWYDENDMTMIWLLNMKINPPWWNGRQLVQVVGAEVHQAGVASTLILLWMSSALSSLSSSLKSSLTESLLQSIYKTNHHRRRPAHHPSLTHHQLSSSSEILPAEQFELFQLLHISNSPRLLCQGNHHDANDDGKMRSWSW